MKLQGKRYIMYIILLYLFRLTPKALASGGLERLCCKKGSDRLEVLSSSLDRNDKVFISLEDPAFEILDRPVSPRRPAEPERPLVIIGGPDSATRRRRFASSSARYSRRAFANSSRASSRIDSSSGTSVRSSGSAYLPLTASSASRLRFSTFFSSRKRLRTSLESVKGSAL